MNAQAGGSGLLDKQQKEGSKFIASPTPAGNIVDSRPRLAKRQIAGALPALAC
jgi:hypothetical protein